MNAAGAGGPEELASTEEQIEAVAEAVRESRHVLEHVCRYHDDWFDEDLRETVARACREVEPLWDKAAVTLNINVQTQLRDAGLLGAQGEAKVRGIKKWAREFFRNPNKRFFGKVAKWMNILLGSLASIVPGGEALKEFKEVVEAALEEE